MRWLQKSLLRVNSHFSERKFDRATRLAQRASREAIVNLQLKNGNLDQMWTFVTISISMANYSAKHRSRGFTLIEMVVVTVILFLLVGFLGYLSIRHFWVYNNQISELNVEGDARSALDDIDNYVRSAYRVISNYESYSTSENTLILQIPSINSSNRVIAGKYDKVVFFISNASLIRDIFSDPSSSRVSGAKTLTGNSNVDALSFSYDNANYSLVKQIAISITVRQGSGNYERSLTISSKSSLRNY